MSTALQVAQLRTTAKNLRTVSGAIGASRALSLYSLAGTDTWVGPTAQACFDELIALRRQLQMQQQLLVDSARLFERRADELERHPTSLVRLS